MSEPGVPVPLRPGLKLASRMNLPSTVVVSVTLAVAVGIDVDLIVTRVKSGCPPVRTRGSEPLGRDRVSVTVLDSRAASEISVVGVGVSENGQFRDDVALSRRLLKSISPLLVMR